MSTQEFLRRLIAREARRPQVPDQLAEIARHVAELRTTSPSRRSHSIRTARLLMSRLAARVHARLHANAGSRSIESAGSHAVPLSH